MITLCRLVATLNSIDFRTFDKSVLQQHIPQLLIPHSSFPIKEQGEPLVL